MAIVFDFWDFPKHRHKDVQVAPHQRFATRKPNFRDAHSGKDAGYAGNFFVGQNLRLWQPNRIDRHAEIAPEVASVSDRNSQLPSNATKFVLERFGFMLKRDVALPVIAHFHHLP
jgi:hypothetical protein